MRRGKSELSGSPGSWQESSSSLISLVPSGSVWSSYRKSCVDMVMKWLVPESSGRYVNRMTNEALHKGRKCPIQAGRLILPWIPGMLDVRSGIQLWLEKRVGNHWGTVSGTFWVLLGQELATVLDKWVMALRRILLCRVLTEGPGRQ